MINRKSVTGGESRAKEQPPAPPNPAAKLSTGTLVAIGYRPYRIVRGGWVLEVWAKSVEDVTRYSPGEVTPIPMHRGTVVASDAVILIDPQDRGNPVPEGTSEKPRGAAQGPMPGD